MNVIEGGVEGEGEKQIGRGREGVKKETGGDEIRGGKREERDL